MCILTFMPAGVTIGYENARRSAISNPDGFGFAIHTSTAIITDHDMNFEKLWARFTEARKHQAGPALLHFRIATHGSVDTDNCHPFYVGESQDSVLAHNGMLPLTMPIHDSRSDTRLFAEIILPHCGGIEQLDDKEFWDSLEEWSIGSKMVIMTINPTNKYDWYIVNEQAGHWADDGVWYSNTSYKPYTYPMRGMYSDGYNDGWDTYASPYSGFNKPVPDSQYELSFFDDETDNEAGFDLLGYLMEELYDSEEWVEKIMGFTEFNDDYYAKVECINCGETCLVDPVEPSHTHCSACNACLVCANTGICECWKGYEYHQSYTPKRDKLETKQMEVF